MRWVWPPDDFFVERDLPKLQHVPLLLEASSYPIEVNRYVEERCLGEWSPAMLDDDEDPIVLTKKSRSNLATRLCAFFYWLNQNSNRDWRQLEYIDVLGYQAGLLLGTANSSKRPLKEGSVNGYVDEACAFLKWAFVRGLRQEFKVPKRKARITHGSSGKHAHSHKARTVTVRQGALQTPSYDPHTLPAADQIERWMATIYKRHPVKALMFELIIRAGCRISEVRLLRVSCFPRMKDWKDSWLQQSSVPIRLRYGVKGAKVSPASDLSIRSRTIYVPLALAERIEHYLKWVRPNLLGRHHRGERKNAPRTDILWLGENTYQPLAYSTLYKAWTQGPHCPLNWHPHQGRHYFAVEILVESIRNFIELNSLQNQVKAGGIGWLHGLMAGQIKLILSPLLGHVDDNTSQIYLRCAHARLQGEFGHPLIRWNQLIDADLEDASNG